MLHARIGTFACVRSAWLAVSAFVGLAAAASASDWYVDQAWSPCSSSDGSPGKPYCTIGAAVAVANPGDTIHVASGTYQENLNIKIDLTILGTSGAVTTTVDGGITIDGSNSAILDLTIHSRNGVGIMVVRRATASVTDCIVAGNVAYMVEGAGLRSVDASDVTITRTTFQSNISVQAYGGGVYVDGGTCTIVDCVFDANSADQGEGICARGGVLLTVESTTFKNHTDIVGMYGGGLLLEDSTTVAALTGCTFLNNRVQLGGGAINAQYASVDVADSTFDSNAASVGGAISVHSAPITCERCTFHANEATGWRTYAGHGGAIVVGFGNLSITDSTFDSNVADASSSHGSGAGGMSVWAGTASLARCRFLGNVSNSAFGRAGGALDAGGTLTATDCEFTGNRGDPSSSGPGGPGAIFAEVNCSIWIARCTIGGNTTNSSGGGVFLPVGGNIYLSNSIIAGNTAGTGGAPDVDGFVTSQDWNDFGDSTGLRKLFGPHDLLDVDPLFVDPSNGDFSLQSTSPCVDSGDPTATPSGPDVGSNPRLLDGNLDRVLVLDRGAREFDNVHLDVTGTPTPGGSLTLTSSGTNGLSLLLIAGAAPGELFVNPLGALFIDLTQPFLIVPFGTNPTSQTFTLDPSFPAPVSIWLQEVAIGAGAGNLSNVVEVDVQ